MKLRDRAIKVLSLLSPNFYNHSLLSFNPMRQSKKRRRIGIPHILDIAESLSSDAWMKWAEKQETESKDLNANKL